MDLIKPSTHPPLFAVMGNPIAHSLSPMIHQYFAKQTGIILSYEKVEVMSQFEQHVIQFFNHGGKGLNITVPYKEQAYRLARVKTKRCETAGAANTLWFAEGGIHADNTDGIGLVRDLKRHIALKDKTILIFGAGGAARGIIGPLLATHPKAIIISNRTLEKAHQLQAHFKKIEVCAFKELKGPYDLIINATSASLDTNHLPISPSVLAYAPFCYDLAYDQSAATPFVHWARTQKCPAVDGFGMLVEQAAEAFYLWHGVKPDTSMLIKKDSTVNL